MEVVLAEMSLLNKIAMNQTLDRGVQRPWWRLITMINVETSVRAGVLI